MNKEMNDKMQKFWEEWAAVDVSGINRMNARSRKRRHRKNNANICAENSGNSHVLPSAKA